VGGRGVTLSGGQKARIALARAVYADASIYLLDDPLSAVDAHVGKTIWNQVVLGYLRSLGATVIIASHQTQYFNDCDRVIYLADGKIAHFDTVPNLINKGVKILGITGETSTSHSPERMETVYSTEISAIPKETQPKSSKKGKPGSATVKEADASKGKLIKEETMATDSVKLETYCRWFKSGSIALAVLMLLFVSLAQGLSQYQSIMVTHWSQDKYGWTAKELGDRVSEIKIEMTGCNNDGGLNEIYCDKDLGTYALRNVIVAGLNPTEDFSSNIGTRAQVMQKCAEEKGASLEINTGQPSNKYIILYAGVTLGIVILNYVGTIFLASFSLSVSKKLHDMMLFKVLRTKMSFFDTTPQGRITNRFSKDTNSVDQGVLRFA